MNSRLPSALAVTLCTLLVAGCDSKKDEKPAAKADDKAEPKKAEAKTVEAKADDAKADDAKADDAKADEPDTAAPDAAEDGLLEDGTDEETPGPVFAEGDLLLEHEKVGELYLGMSGADLVKVLGEPKSKGKIIEQGATGEFVASWSYPGKGIYAEMVFDDAKGTNPSVGGLTANEHCAFALPWGLKIGSTRAEVEKVYGEHFDPDMTTEDTFIAGSIYGGSMYDFENGKVVGLFIGAGAE